MFVVLCAIKKWPKLKSGYRQCIEAAIKYVRTIDDFEDLVYPRTLALHCLGPELSAYVLCIIEIEEKKSKCLLSSSLLLFSSFFSFSFFNKCFSFTEMMMKFNQGMYKKMRAKKNEPLSNLRRKVVRVVEKGVSVTPSPPVTEPTRTAFLGYLSGRNYPTPKEATCGR